MKYIWRSFDYNGNELDLLDLFKYQPHVFFLDSSQHDPHRGRYSFIGFDPFDVFAHKGGDVLDRLKERFNRFAEINSKEYSASFSPLTSGIVGCLSYDYGLHQEKIRPLIDDNLGGQSGTKRKNVPTGLLSLPDCFFGFYDCILTIDHFTQKLIVTSTGLPEKNQYLREKRAKQRLEDIIVKLEPALNGAVNTGKEFLAHSPESSLVLKCNISKTHYMEMVQKALDYISCGDIYQVNLSQRFELDLSDRAFDAFSLYKALRQYSPSPFGGFLDGGNFQLISNSPERFLRLNKGIVQTRPMKGTRPRGDNEYQDAIYRQEILNSEKEKAELLMITDLQRNDLGRVCEYGSVFVREMRTLEEYKYVFQATSTIEGVLRKDKDCFDLIRAAFPGGSVTGCPKIRAMEVIEELEPTRRGMYTGSLGYINFDGNMDFNILIRTLFACPSKLYFQVGGGIVADSIPENEYNETLIKARAMKACLEAGLLRKDPVGGHK